MNKMILVLIVIFVAAISTAGALENYVGLELQEMFVHSTDEINCFCDDTDADCILPPDQAACDLIISAP